MDVINKYLKFVGLNILINSFNKRTSTSIHSLNNDKGLKKFERILYLIYNWVNNLFPYLKIEKNLDIRDFKCPNIDEFWDKLYTKSSPSRKLSDLFWMYEYCNCRFWL